MLDLSEVILSYIYEISVDYMISRYPDTAVSVPYEQYDRHIAEEKVKSAQNIFEILRDSYSELIEDNNNA